MSRRRAEQTTDPCLVVFLEAAPLESPLRARPLAESLDAARRGLEAVVARILALAGGRRARRLRRSARRVGAVALAVVLAVVPGTLVLAAAVLVWHRLAQPEGVAAADVARVEGARRQETSAGALAAGQDASTGAPATGQDASAGAPATGQDASAGAPATETPHRAAAKEDPGVQGEGTLETTPTATPTAAPADGVPAGTGPRGGSCSAGSRVSGPLHRAARLPDRGPGFTQLFPHRGLAYGTDELVSALRRAGARLHRAGLPPLVIANLSGPEGSQEGQDPFHPAVYARSHGSGRAADLAFFLRDALGRPAPAVETNLAFDPDGGSRAGMRRLYLREGEAAPDGCHSWRSRAGWSEAVCPLPEGAFRIDFERTWSLIEALLTDPEIGVVDPVTGVSRADGGGVRFIFVTSSHRRRLLEAAERAGAPEALVQLASILLHPPSNAPPFDSYLHVDVWCTDADRRDCGCDDGSGPWNRWRAGAQVLGPAVVAGR